MQNRWQLIAIFGYCKLSRFSASVIYNRSWNLNSRRTSRIGATVSDIKNVVPWISCCVFITISFMMRFKTPLFFIPITACFYLCCWWHCYSSCHIVNFNYKNYIMLELNKLFELEWTAEVCFLEFSFSLYHRIKKGCGTCLAFCVDASGTIFQVWHNLCLSATTV
jgi:hypothetical protein